jgi:aspartyl-tRNA(Asn)/glutamyl-tRNA(Gln) amidotransferase subunit C
MNKQEVKKLADLARIRISDEQAESLTHEFEAILAYIGEVREINDLGKIELKKNDFPVRNVLREDVKPHEAGLHTAELLSSAPARDENFIKVKQILS